MLPTIALRLIVILLGLGLIGCATNNKYTPPPGLTPQTAATLVGSKVPQPGLASDLRNYIVSVDGALTEYGKYRWDEPLLVPAGAHDLELAVSKGGLFGSGFSKATLKPGSTYIVKADLMERGLATAWIEDEDGVAVTDKVKIRMGGGGAVVPIFIPMR